MSCDQDCSVSTCFLIRQHATRAVLREWLNCTCDCHVPNWYNAPGMAGGKTMVTNKRHDHVVRTTYTVVQRRR